VVDSLLNKEAKRKEEASYYNLKPILLTNMVEVRIARKIKEVISPARDLNLILSHKKSSC